MEFKFFSLTRESGWELGSYSNDVLANTADKNKVNLEGNGERCNF